MVVSRLMILDRSGPPLLADTSNWLISFRHEDYETWLMSQGRQRMKFKS
jgi:hypothetical protein